MGTTVVVFTRSRFVVKAIRFVLSDAYTSMSREERQALLHEGVSTTTTLSAYGLFLRAVEPSVHLNPSCSRNCVRQL